MDDKNINVEILQSLSFFDLFSPGLLEAITPYFKLANFEQDQIILDQNQFNASLYFLLEGSVNIFVDDEYVVTIQEKGEVFGEISIAAHTTCSAKVLANGPCQFAIFNYQQLQQLDDQVRLQVERYLFKSCAEVLAKKLVETNEIAKTYRMIYQQQK